MEQILIQALERFFGPLRQLFTNLLGSDTELWGNELKKFLRQEPCWVKELKPEVAKKTKRVLTPFFTIATGGTNAKQLILDIRENKNHNYVADIVTNCAWSMMMKKAFTVSKETGLVKLVVLSITELGFTSSPITTDFMTALFCTRWSKENLEGYVIELCQPEDGPQLRNQWRDQPKDTCVYMAMERIKDKDRDLSVFIVDCRIDARRSLDNSKVSLGGQWLLSCPIVFRLRKIV